MRITHCGELTDTSYTETKQGSSLLDRSVKSLISTVTFQFGASFCVGPPWEHQSPALDSCRLLAEILPGHSSRVVSMVQDLLTGKDF